MCGILGTIGFKDNSKFNLKLLEHRGPDSFGKWSSPENEFPLVLGHTRLAILDISNSGNQPFLVDNDRYVFIFNGEIYNFLELKKQFEDKGQVFKTQTDTEVFLRGLILEGPEFQLRCNGMWSFCLWDRKEKSALFGRDRFGKKPFFYSLLDNEKLVFASEMKAIYPFLNSIKLNKNINIYLQKLFDYESSEECVVSGIKRLQPGHYAYFKEGKLKSKRWWNTLDHLEVVPKNYNDQVQRWREIFLDSVKIRMRSDVRIGTALSGGLDSSAILSAMNFLKKKNNNQFREAKDWQNAFCSHYPGSSIDELKWARVASNETKVPLQEINIDPTSCEWSIKDALYQVEDPYLTLPFPMLTTYQAISRKGVKVTIDGHGADELLGGYGELSSAFRLSNRKQTAELVAIIESIKSGKYHLNNKKLNINFIKYKLIEFLKFNLRKPKDIIKNLFTGNSLDYLRYKLNYSDQTHPKFKELDPLSQNLYENFHVTILPTLLRNYDRYSMASGVEIRMPFMDHRLVCYTFSLPWDSKVGGTFTKRIMRDALKGILPEKIRVRRDKIGWNAPLHEWFQDSLRKEIEELIINEKLSKKTINAWKKFQKKSNPNFNDGQKIWRKLMPELWKKSLKLKDIQ